MPRKRGRPKMADQVEIKARRIKALELKTQGYTYEQVAEMLDYHDRAHVFNDIRQELRRLIEEENHSLDEYLRQELQKLDVMELKVWEILRKWHPALNKDKDACIVMTDPNGKEVWLENSEATLSAIDRLMKIQAQRSRLLGLEQQKVGIDLNVRYAIDGVDMGSLK